MHSVECTSVFTSKFSNNCVLRFLRSYLLYILNFFTFICFSCSVVLSAFLCYWLLSICFCLQNILAGILSNIRNTCCVDIFQSKSISTWKCHFQIFSHKIILHILIKEICKILISKVLYRINYTFVAHLYVKYIKSIFLLYKSDKSCIF